MTASRVDHFVPHIQGLRALAVLLVVVYHFWPNRLSGGYIGVDVFFVISGFLITGQLARSITTQGRVSLPEFWAKRIRRLIPAALFVLAISLALVTFVMPLAYFPESLRDVGASTLYAQNWSLALNSVDYLASSSRTIAEHYWSLSLEEQFYVVWPLILMSAVWLGGRRLAAGRNRVLVIATMVVLLASFALSVWFTGIDPAQAYFVLFTRMWEFGAGALIVLLGVRARRPWLSNVLGFGGLATIIVGALLLDRSSPFPGWLAIIPVLGTSLVLMMSDSRRWWHASGLLSLRPVRFIGDISYSLYLWHWPLIIVAPFVAGWGLTFVNRVILFLGCFVLAWLTKRLVEDPIRRLPYLTSRKPRFTFGWMLVALGVMGALMLAAFALQNPRYDAAAAQLEKVTAHPPPCFGAEVITGCSNPRLANSIIPSPEFGNADRPGHGECFVQLNDARVTECHLGSDNGDALQIALIGDSHAYQYIDAVVAQANTRGWSVTTYLKGGCPWTTTEIGGTNPAFTASCNEWHRGVAAALADRPRFDAIITTALSENLIDSAGSVDAAARGLVDAWTSQSHGAPVIVISDNPVLDEDPNKCLRHSTPLECDVSRETSLLDVDPLVLAAARVPTARLLDLRSLFCDDASCWVVIGGADVYRDADHLTATFANTVGPFIAGAVAARG